MGNLTHVKFFKIFFKANLMILCQHQFYHLIKLEKFFCKIILCVPKNRKKLCKYLHAKEMQNECVSRFRGSKCTKKYTNTKNIQNTHQSLFCNKIGIKIRK